MLEWSWLTTPIKLYWSVEVENGMYVQDIMELTVTGTSACSNAIFETYSDLLLETTPDDPALSWV